MPTHEDIQRAAPDQASLTAASGLRKASKWPLLAQSAARGLVWGECQGSGAAPYRVVSELDDLGTNCSCPSRKFPCKHGLALLWMFVDKPETYGEQPVPEWVEAWLGRRRKKAPVPVDASAPAAVKDIAAAAAGPATAAVDPERAARAEAAAEKRAQNREADVDRGIDELDRWLQDVVAEGLGAFVARAPARCRTIAARLSDARAAGLARRLDELPGRLYAVPDARRDAFLVAELGRIALLVSAWRRRDRLPEALVADVRARIGWTVEREELLADAGAVRITDAWSVMGTRAVAQADRVIRHEAWLRAASGAWALLVDHVPVGAPYQAPFQAGEGFVAELAYYRSAAPLRALVAKRLDAAGASLEAALATAPKGLDAALGAVASQRAKLPWIDCAPVAACDVVVGRHGDAFVLADADGGAAVPIAQDGGLWALAAAGRCAVAGLWEDGQLTLIAASTSQGGWYA